MIAATIIRAIDQDATNVLFRLSEDLLRAGE
jgi:hypothetical protein